MQVEPQPADGRNPAGSGEQEDAALPPGEASDFPSAADLLVSYPPEFGERIWKDHAELFDAENKTLVKHAVGLMFGHNLPRHLAEDIVQEAWADLVPKWDMVDRPLPWMYSVVKKKAHRLASTMTRQSQAETAALHAGRAVPHPVAGMDTIVALHDTLRELAALPEQQLKAIYLRVIEDRPYAEIADLMQIEKNTVGPHLRHARSRLRERPGDLGLAVLLLATLAGAPVIRPVNPAASRGEALAGPPDLAATADRAAAAGTKDEDAAAALRAKVQRYLELDPQGVSEVAALALESSPDSYVDTALSSMPDDERAAVLETLREALSAYTPDSAEVEHVYAA